MRATYAIYREFFYSGETTKMGRKKLSWQELKNRGSKVGRWQARHAEQLAEAASKNAIAGYVNAFALEDSSPVLFAVS